MFEILFFIYAVGFVIYFLKCFGENYESWTESNPDMGPVSKFVLTIATTLAIGPLYALAWPYVYYKEQQAEEEKAATNKTDE